MGSGEMETSSLGGSFGGYSALWGMAFHPGFYKCAVAIVPIASVGAANEQSKKSFGGSPLIAKYWGFVFGEEVSNDKKAAVKASPMYHMDRVCEGSSIALFHGENDPRAPLEHSCRVVEELKKLNLQGNKQWREKGGVSGEFVTFADEGHGIAKEANVLFMYDRIEKFLREKFGMTNNSGNDSDELKVDVSITLNAEWTKGNTATVQWLERGDFAESTTKLTINEEGKKEH